jgi:hypothetical protein
MSQRIVYQPAIKKAGDVKTKRYRFALVTGALRI